MRLIGVLLAFIGSAIVPLPGSGSGCGTQWIMAKDIQQPSQHPHRSSFLLSVDSTDTAPQEQFEGRREPPTKAPSRRPSLRPTRKPTAILGAPPSFHLTFCPTIYIRTSAPTNTATSPPISRPTGSPTSPPTQSLTSAPTRSPTDEPSEEPTYLPTVEPTASLSSAPSQLPTNRHTNKPTRSPICHPTVSPSFAPTVSSTVLKSPSQILNLSNWNLQLPLPTAGVADSSLTVSKSSLQTYFGPYFYSISSGAVVFYTPVISESGRTELKETDVYGNSVGWYPTYAVSTLSATVAINVVPTVNAAVNKIPFINIGQIKGSGSSGGSSSPLATVQYRYNPRAATGEVLVQVQADPTLNTAADYVLAHNVSLNQTFTYLVSITQDPLTELPSLTVSVDGDTAYPPLSATWATNTVYFKAGVVLGDIGTSATGSGQATFYSLTVTHAPLVSVNLQLGPSRDSFTSTGSVVAVITVIIFLSGMFIGARRLKKPPSGYQYIELPTTGARLAASTLPYDDGGLSMYQQPIFSSSLPDDTVEYIDVVVGSSDPRQK
jgi:hypothetical protein